MKKCVQTKNIYGYTMSIRCAGDEWHAVPETRRCSAMAPFFVPAFCCHHEPRWEPDGEWVIALGPLGRCCLRCGSTATSEPETEPSFLSDFITEHLRCEWQGRFIYPVHPKAAEPQTVLPEPAFWLVWRDGYNSTPHLKHDTEAEARVEAERLAQSNPGDAFYVLPATSYAKCAIQPVTWTRGDAEGLEAEEPPF